MAKARPAARERRVQIGKRLITQLRDSILSVIPSDAALKKALRLLQPVLDSNAAVALFFDPRHESFRLAEQVGLSTKQSRGLQAFLPSLSGVAKYRGGGGRTPPKSNGSVLHFTEAESRQRGISSVLVYYLVCSKQLVGALVFCRTEGGFPPASVAALDAVSGLLALLADNQRCREMALEASGSADLDGLTGLYNHRYFQQILTSELMKSRRFGHKVALLMIDIDHFKTVNDRYGHPQGDAALKETAKMIEKTLRAYDIPARYGGEEFAVVLPHTDRDHAFRVAERMRKSVEAHPFQGVGTRHPLSVTISVGVASYPANASTKAELIDRADQALYLAKSEGRNRVCLSLAHSSELLKVGFCPPALTSPYYRSVMAGMEDVVKEIKQIELLTHAPQREDDYHVLERLFKKFVREKPDAVAICSQSPSAVRELQILHEAKIPVFVFNVPETLGDRSIRSYVGYDQAQAGKAVGRLLARLLRGRGRLAIIEGLPEPTNRLRVAGFREALKPFPEMTIVASERADWMPSLARKATARLLRQHKDLDAVFAASDAMALGAVEAVKAKGKLGSIFIVGLDGTEEALQSIKDGALTATLDTSPRDMGRVLLRTIVRGLIKEEKVARQIESPIRIVTAENVDRALNP